MKLILFYLHVEGNIYMHNLVRSSRDQEGRSGMMSAVKLVLRPVSALRPAFSMMGVLAVLGSIWVPSSATAASFGHAGEGAGEFFVPVGAAVNQETGQLIVADRNNDRVESFDEDGTFISGIGWGVADGTSQESQTCTTRCFAGVTGAGDGQFASPEHIAVDNDLLSPSHGDFYVADRRNNRVEKFDASGEFVLMFGGHVNATAVEHGETANENVCPVNPGDRCQAGTEGPGNGEFEAVGALAVDATGKVSVGDVNRVERFDEDGVFESDLSLPNAGFILEVAAGAGGDLFVLSQELEGEQTLALNEYDAAGKVLATFDEGHHIQAIAVDTKGELFLTDTTNGFHIREYDTGTAQEVATFGAVAGLSGRGIGIREMLGEPDKLYVTFQFEREGEPEFGVEVFTQPGAGPLVEPGSEQAAEVRPTSAGLNATINPEGVATQYHFQYGTTAAYGESTPVSPPLTAVNEVQSVSVTATGGAFTLGFKGDSSVEIPFNADAAEVQTALEGVPTLGAGQTAVSGEAGGPWSVEFVGSRAGAEVPELSAASSGLTGGFEPSATVTTTTPGVSLFDDRAASAVINGLLPRTLYHFRVVATNGSETVDGPDATFTTEPPVSIDSEATSQVTATSARLETDLNPHGVQASFRFEYGTTEAYGTLVPTPDGDAGSGDADVRKQVLVEGLSPGTEYHYRVVATNVLGEKVLGEDHHFSTQTGGPPSLIDGRAWELVSPPNKHGVSLEAISLEGGAIQAAEDGGGIAYFAKGPIASEPVGNRSIADTQLLSTRRADGWHTAELATPHERVAGLLAGELSEYQFFSPDLRTALVEPAGDTPLPPLAPGSERTPYVRHDEECAPVGETAVPATCYQALVTASNVLAGAKFGGKETEPESSVFAQGSGVEIATATPDLTHVVFTSPEDLTAPGFPSGENASVYEWENGTIRLASILPNGKPAAEEGLISDVGYFNLTVRGTVSSDGDRVVFTTRNPSAHLYIRDMGREETLELDAPEGGLPGGGEPRFQMANAQGTKIFFSDTARLTANATAKAGQRDLYMCEVVVSGNKLACVLKDLTVDHNGGEAAHVVGSILGADESGRYVYFVADGALAAGAKHGTCVSSAAIPPLPAPSVVCNLYMYDTITEETRLVAQLAGRDFGDWAGNGGEGGLSELSARVSPNGRYVAFMSEQSLTGFDNLDAASGARDQEVYVYDNESQKLVCASCGGSDARPRGIFDSGVFPGLVVDRPTTWKEQWLAGSIPGWTATSLIRAPYQSRYLSNSGRLFFNSPVALVPADGNGTEDVYEYEPEGRGDCTSALSTPTADFVKNGVGASGGCVGLVSSGTSADESVFFDASGQGPGGTEAEDVFFMTAAKLSPADADSTFDVYDAHVCSAISPCLTVPPAAAPPPCSTADQCRSAASPQPEIFGALASATYSAPGNASPESTKSGAKPPSLTRRKAEELKKALKTCRRERNKHRHATCEKQARRRFGAAKKASAQHHAKQASNKRRASR
jgi:hypothetical protein